MYYQINVKLFFETGMTRTYSIDVKYASRNYTATAIINIAVKYM
jgi:hypothetical protein